MLSPAQLSVTPRTVACQAPLSMGILQTRILEWVAMPSSRAYLRPGHPNPGIEPRTSTLQVDSLLSETPGKPRNTEVGSLSLLQGIFLTQELNWGLLHCRQILYQQATREAQEYWSGEPNPSPADLPDPGIEPGSPTLQADSLPTELSGKPNM